MKTFIQTLFLCFAISNFAYGQTAITYDFKTKTISKTSSDDNHEVKVAIKNINTLLYDITITVDGKELNNTPPVLFKDFFPTIDNLPSVLKELTKGAEEREAAGDSIADKLFGDECDHLLSTLQEIIKELSAEIEKIAFYKALAREPIIDEKFIAEINKIHSGDYFDNLRERLSILYKLTNDYEIVFEAVKIKCESKDVEEFKQLQGISDSLKKIINIDDYIGLLQVLREENFQYTTSSIAVEGDMADISIEIKPKSGLDVITATALKGDSIGFKVYTKNRLDISFSTGLMGSSLTDEEYSAKTNYNPTDTTYSIVKESTGNFVFGPVAYMHFGGRITDGFDITGHLGIGLPLVEKPNPQYLVGISLLFGQENRIGLNFSYAFGKVKRLSGATNMRDYKESPAIDMINKTESGFALSLTYNF